ncbi:hypothetical protein HN873_036769 [Arachis hypogaea]
MYLSTVKDAKFFCLHQKINVNMFYSKSKLVILMSCVSSWLCLQETSSAYYILQQYTAASGGQELQNPIRNAYAMGKVRMVASEFETATRVVKIRNASRCAESGGFVLWQMKQKWAFCGNYSFQVWGDGNEPYQNKNGRGVDN